MKITALDEVCETLRNTDNEGTESPYWLVIDPGRTRNMKTTITQITCCVDGPFFSRKDAEEYLEARRYDYSNRAGVWCASGHHSRKYKALCRELKIGMGGG